MTVYGTLSWRVTLNGSKILVWSYNISVEKIKRYEYSFALLPTPTNLYWQDNLSQAGESTAILSLHPMRAPSNPIQNFPDKYLHKRALKVQNPPFVQFQAFVMLKQRNQIRIQQLWCFFFFCISTWSHFLLNYNTFYVNEFFFPEIDAEM